MADKENEKLDVRREIWESGAMGQSIVNMKRRGVSKSEAVRLSGAPYEIVDRIWRGGEDSKPTDKEK